MKYHSEATLSSHPLLTSLAVLTLGLVPCQGQRGPVPGLDASTPYLIHYGNWTPTLVDQARTNYKLVILHPSASNITPANIATIRGGADNTVGTSDDVKVLAYISVGEDDRPAAPVAGDGQGPRIDPRPNYSDPLDDSIPPLGDPSLGGTGYASYYLDDIDWDGEPDQNATFGGYYVNPGDPAWYEVLKTQTKAIDGRAGIEEILSTYGCDGLFLDTLDTPAPNSFGSTFFEWTSKAYRDLVKNISDDNPGKLLLANRGVFFYNPNFKGYRYTLRPYIDLLMFESYYTDSSGSGAASAFFDDNKHSYAPKINAEANRVDGFTVIALGYKASGDPPALGEMDFNESQGEQGWLLYRTDPGLQVTPFNTEAASWNAANVDSSPPIWDSTAASGADSDPGTAGNQAPVPRIGIQQTIAADSAVTVRWDVARDQTGPVRYNIYYTADPVLDFGTATKLAGVAGTAPENYTNGAGTGLYANEHVINGLVNGIEYQFAVRAEDGLGNEDSNTVTLSATPDVPPPNTFFRTIAIDGDFSDWVGVPVQVSDPVDGSPVDFADVQVANDADYLYVRFTLHAAASPFSDWNSHLFIDRDATSGTGFQVSGGVIGSELMVEGSSGYDQRAGGFNDGAINGLGWSLSPAGPAASFELRVSRSATFATDGAALFIQDAISLALQDNGGETTAAIPYVFAPTPTTDSNYAVINVDGDASDWDAIPVAHIDATGDGTPDITSVKVANDENYLYVLVQYASAVDVNTFNGSPSTYLSIDNDANTATGYDTFGLGVVGADVSWQNDFPFAQAAGVYNLGATFTNGAAGIAPYYANTAVQEYRIARNATYNVGGPEIPVFPNDLIRLCLISDDVSLSEFVGGIDYLFAPTPPDPTPSNFTHIEIDGDASDWDSVPTSFTDTTGESTPDIASVKVANDDDYLYILVQYGGSVDTNTLNGAPSNFLSIDNDANIATGFNTYGLGQIGAEVSWQNDYPFAQDTANFNLGATFTNGAAGISPYFANTTFQEYRIARGATYNVGGPELPVFPNDLIRLALWSDDGSAAEFAGGFNYHFAANPGVTSYEAWKLNRYTASELLNPLVSGETADGDNDGLTTLLEFALGGDPKLSDPQIRPTSAVTDFSGTDHLEFTYFRRNPTGDLSYLPETSSDLGVWDDGPAQFAPVSTTPSDPGFDEVRVRLTAPVGTGPSFIRLKVISNP